VPARPESILGRPSWPVVASCLETTAFQDRITATPRQADA
jgi:hypothetical protein